MLNAADSESESMESDDEFQISEICKYCFLLNIWLQTWWSVENLETQIFVLMSIPKACLVNAADSEPESTESDDGFHESMESNNGFHICEICNSDTVHSSKWYTTCF